MRLDRRERRNALDAELVEGMLETVLAPAAAAIVLSSATPGVFCAGIDRTLSRPDRARVSDRLYELYEQMLACPSVIVAALDGHAIGGGAQLALASDIRIAGAASAIRLAGPGHGLAVGAWGLPSLVGRGAALDLCVSMRAVGAEEALRIGLVDRLSDTPEATALELAEHIASLDSGAVARCKRIAAAATGVLAALALEREGNAGWDGDLERGRTEAVA